MKKGTLLITRDAKKIYQVAGRWGKDIVILPMSDEDDQVLIYGAGELDSLIADGHFRKLHETGVTV